MKQLRNPFYVLLMITGVIFTITMCAYMVMTLQLGQRGGPEPVEGSLIDILERHGLTIIVVEIVVLGICTVAAIATDEYWTGGEGSSEEK